MLFQTNVLKGLPRRVKYYLLFGYCILAIIFLSLRQASNHFCLPTEKNNFRRMICAGKQILNLNFIHRIASVRR